LAVAGGEDVAAGVLAVTGTGGGCVDWGDEGEDGGEGCEGCVEAAAALPAPGALVALFPPCAADVALSGLAAAAADFAVGATGAAAGVAAGALVAAAGAVAA
jgi:hypothetical protein